MTRAVLEGVAFGLRDGLDVMVGAGLIHPNSVRMSGGGARSAIWRQIVADVLEADVAVAGSEEGAAYGAATLASVGAGLFATVDDAVARTVSVKVSNRPSGRVDVYKEIHGRYQGLYPALRPTFHAAQVGPT
jgi:xylulokinase